MAHWLGVSTRDASAYPVNTVKGILSSQAFMCSGDTAARCDHPENRTFIVVQLCVYDTLLSRMIFITALPVSAINLANYFLFLISLKGNKLHALSVLHYDYHFPE